MHTFAEFALRYTDARPLSPVYAGTLRARAAALQNFAGRADLPGVLDEKIVSDFLRSLTCAPHTVAKYRTDLLCLWRAAADDDLATYPVARRVWRPKVAPLVVECFTVDEARRIALAAERLPGWMPGGIRRRHYWPAMLRVAWDTGLRRGDLWGVTISNVRPDGSLLVAQRKTGSIVECELRPSTVAWLSLVERLAWPLCVRAFGEHFGRLCVSAGVYRGTFRWLRRASGSYVEAQQPGSGHKHLGQSSPAVFSRHYDARLGDRTLPRPPEL